VSFLRSSFFVALVSLFVATAYGYDVLEDQCDEVRQEQSPQGPSDHDGVPAEGADGCQCLCHATFSAPLVELVSAPATEPAATERFVIRDEIPPETVPLGIEYPPQLA
jgi:hypothetical protein